MPMLDPVLWPVTAAINGLLVTAWLGAVMLGALVRTAWWIMRHTVLRNLT